MAQMNYDEMMKRFDELYEKMASSTNIEDMKLFGRTCRKAVSALAVHIPSLAMEIIDELCALNWNNYVTNKEVDDILRRMEPKPKWSIDQVLNSLPRIGLPTEEAPYYNSNALYITISMKYSDSAKTIAETILKKPLESIDDLEMLSICWHLAVDVLKDKDRNFSIRKYFNL